MTRTRQWVTQAARECGLAGQQLSDFVLAAQELMTNAVRHGGGWGRIQLYRDDDTLICVVTDRGPGFPAGPVSSDAIPPGHGEGGRGLFLARQVTDSMHMKSTPAGVQVTVTMNLLTRG